MTLHIPSWIIYTALYGASGSVLLILITAALYIFQRRSIGILKNTRYYWFARLLMWSKYSREKEEANIWKVISLHAQELREENPERFRQINQMLNFSSIQDTGERITKAVQEYLADPEKQKRSDMESVIIEVLVAA